MLQAVPAHGGARAQRIEVERLRAFVRPGCACPTVLHVDAQLHRRQPLSGAQPRRARRRRRPAGWDAWRDGLDAIAEVHARGEYLSHAFARNFIAERGAGLAMIDFEVDPLEVLSLHQAQARDWLAYLHSTLWLLTVAGRCRPVVREPPGPCRARRARPSKAPVAACALLRHLPRSRRIWRPRGRRRPRPRRLLSLLASASAAA